MIDREANEETSRRVRDSAFSSYDITSSLLRSNMPKMEHFACYGIPTAATPRCNLLLPEVLYKLKNGAYVQIDGGGWVTVASCGM